MRVLPAAFCLCFAGFANAAEVVVVPHTASEMVYVPEGVFFMGFLNSPVENDSFRRQCRQELGGADLCKTDLLFTDARPARKVYLEAFEIDRTEVTVAAYRFCVEQGFCDVAPLVIGDTRYLRDEWPMTNVSWGDADGYCRFRGKRLPTEAEWEKAARGADGRRWPWGNVVRNDGANHGRLEGDALLHVHTYVIARGRISFIPEYVEDPSDGFRYLAPPGSMRWGASPYGAMDMAGNVSEWVFDYYWGGVGPDEGGYSDLGDVSPVRAVPKDGGFGARRVVRDGSWIRPLLFSRVYARLGVPPHLRSKDVGFRCARDVGSLR